MSNLTLQVDVLAGADIEMTIHDAAELCKKLDLAFVCFDFNGVKMSISRKANIPETVKQFNEALQSKKYKLVVA